MVNRQSPTVTQMREVLQRNSPSGRLANLQSEVDQLPQDDPFVRKMLEALENAREFWSRKDGQRTQWWLDRIAPLMLQRQDYMRFQDRSRAGKSAAESRREAASEAHDKICAKARDLLKQGCSPRELSGRIERHGFQKPDGEPYRIDAIRKILKKAGLR